MNDEQAREFVKGLGLSWGEKAEVIRYCIQCQRWVDINEYNANLNRCDEC